MESWKEELYHHGIQGQRWGVRRFQNQDGTLTVAGKKRYSDVGAGTGRPGTLTNTGTKNGLKTAAANTPRRKSTGTSNTAIVRGATGYAGDSAMGVAGDWLEMYLDENSDDLEKAIEAFIEGFDGAGNTQYVERLNEALNMVKLGKDFPSRYRTSIDRAAIGKVLSVLSEQVITNLKFAKKKSEYTESRTARDANLMAVKQMGEAIKEEKEAAKEAARNERIRQREELRRQNYEAWERSKS